MSYASPQTDPIRILVADDHPVVLEGLAAVIEHQTYLTVVVVKARNGQEAVTLFHQHQPDVTILNPRMPEIDGVEAIEMMRALRPDARIIVFTTYDDDEDIYKALRAGAKAYLLKGTPWEELLETIQAVYAGQTRISSEVAAKLTARMGGPVLTPRELEVLQLVVVGKSNKEIGTTLHISERTVKRHVNSILHKLHRP